MDVTCPRCQTDYEFDDALVSERGTTVKCTNCGHQFRVFRPRAGSEAPSPELWRIERRDGEPMELRSLVELQRAIRAGQVARTDLLRRGEGPARRLGDIPELEPFFPAQPAEGRSNTLPLPAVAAPVARPAPAAHTPQYGGKPISVPPPRPLPRPSDRPPPRAAPSAPPPPRLSTPAGIVAAAAEPPPVRRTDAARSVPPPAPARAAATTTSVPPSAESYESMFPPPRRSGRGGVAAIGALLAIGGLVGVGATVGRPYLQRALGGTGSAPPSASAGGDRLARELAAGERARADGDWSGARDAYLRATVLDEKSLAAWDGLCEAESDLAVTHWIAALASQSALERDQAAAIGASATKSCGRWSEIARAAPEGAKKVGVDLRPVRALAAQGDAASVRVYLPAHPGDPIVEALAYLADAPKADPAAVATAAKQAATALARAKIASLTAPSDLALVAYGASVTGATARREEALAELRKHAPRHVLLEVLHGASALGDATPPALDGGATSDAATDANHPVVAVAGGGGGGGEGASLTGDYRSLDEKGHKALATGDPTKAEGYFKAALAQHPGDVDALFGLGQIARSRGDHANAIAYFKQVLDTSAGFAPARLALADEQWSTGDQASAKKNYELYLDRVSEGSGADRARSRTGKTSEKPAEQPKGEE